MEVRLRLVQASDAANKKLVLLTPLLRPATELANRGMVHTLQGNWQHPRRTQKGGSSQCSTLLLHRSCSPWGAAAFAL